MTRNRRRSSKAVGRSTAAAALIAALLAGCSGIWPATFSSVFPARDESGSMRLAEQPVDVVDLTGLVTGVAVPADPDPEGATSGLVARVEQASVRLSWIGGACESRTRIFFGHDRDGDGYAARLRSDTSFGGMVGCPGLGIYRSVVLTLRDSIEGNQVTFRLAD